MCAMRKVDFFDNTISISNSQFTLIDFEIYIIIQLNEWPGGTILGFIVRIC
jgi:hypothetical protein